MKFLFYMGHPAHVHVFRNLIIECKNRGHESIIALVDKEISKELLEIYKLKFKIVAEHRKRLFGKIMNLFWIGRGIYNLSIKEKPDILIGIANAPLSFVGKLLSIRTIVLDDTEKSIYEILMYKYFVDIILSPRSFLRNLGSKHVKYPSYHELAYLHPDFYSPDRSIKEQLGIRMDQKYIFLRFVSWDANHDRGQKGLSTHQKIDLVKSLSKYGRIIISSECPLPASLRKYRIPFPLERIHDVLSEAEIFIGEGASMASECAVLGTPAIYVNSITLGYLKEQEQKYGLVYHFTDGKGVKSKAIELLEAENLRKEWANKRHRMLEDNKNLTRYLLEIVLETLPN